MKRYFLYAFAALMFPFFMSCSDPFDDSAIWDQIEELKTRVQALEAKVADATPKLKEQSARMISCMDLMTTVFIFCMTMP